MKAYTHQAEALSACSTMDPIRSDDAEFAWLMEMGTGKTATDIWDSGKLFARERINGWIIIAPKGVYRGWATKELPKFADFHYRVAVFSADNLKAGRDEVAALCSGPVDPNVLDILLVNVESLATPKKAKRPKKAGARKVKVHPKARDVINDFFRSHNKIKTSIDESTRIKNPEAKCTKACWKIGRVSKFRRILTGFPYPQAPLDAFGQFYFLNPSILRYPNIHAFKAHYAIMKSMEIRLGGFDDFGKPKTRKIKVVTGYRNIPELQERVARYSFRALKKDCLDLPTKVYTSREVELTDEQQDVYDEVLEFGFKEFAAAETVTVQMKLTLNLRLQQVVAGHVGLDDKTVRRLKSNRVSAVLDTLEETSGKVVLWSHQVPTIEDLVAGISKRFGPPSVSGFYGATKDRDREGIINRFQDPDDLLRFFVANPQTGGAGLTLTAASTALYVTNSFNLEHRVQSEDRIHRIGQLLSTLYTDFISPGTIEMKVREALVIKKQTATQALGENWDEWLRVAA